MSKVNDITISSYNNELDIYLKKTAGQVTGSMKDFIDSFLKILPPNATILEIGSGTGRDADYIEKRGYTILRTDAAASFVKHMQDESKPAEKLNIIAEALPQTFDAILANAVFLHFDDADFKRALINTKAMLKNNGIFAFSIHKGDFIGISDHKNSARYFHERSERDVHEILKSHSLTVLKSMRGTSISGRKQWIMFIVQAKML